ncbi:Alkaline phytoceramidase (aPHC) [Abeliophyllum distichum]|uniref:Alkaline phytoceramidase (APHC) n=1 Tax=Abeliophyllum distichum TaxID=126358 RepID=A0ABD1PU28_9LAMI
MAGNEWINGYLEAILYSGASAIEENKPTPVKERGNFNSTKLMRLIFIGHGSRWSPQETPEREVPGSRICVGAFGILPAKRNSWNGRIANGEKGDGLGEIGIDSPRKKFQRNFSNVEVWSDSKKEKKLYIVLIRQQQGDETPMVWEMLLYFYILYSPVWHYRSTMPTFLFLYGAVFAIAHSQLRFDIGFEVHYAFLCLLYIHTEDKSAKQLAKLYVATLFFGSLCWLIDSLFCKSMSHWYFISQGHALWHVLMGFNSYFANAFLIYCHAQQREWDPKIKHFLGFFPYL